MLGFRWLFVVGGVVLSCVLLGAALMLVGASGEVAGSQEDDGEPAAPVEPRVPPPEDVDTVASFEGIEDYDGIWTGTSWVTAETTGVTVVSKQLSEYPWDNSPDGEISVVQPDGTTEVIAELGEDQVVKAEAKLFDITPDGSTVVLRAKAGDYYDRETNLYTLDVASGVLTQVRGGSEGIYGSNFYSASISADGEIIAWQGYEVGYINDGETTTDFRPEGPANEPQPKNHALLADGTLLFEGTTSADDDSKFTLMHPDYTMEVLDVPWDGTNEHAGYREGFDVSDDGTVIAWSAAGRPVIWDRTETSGVDAGLMSHPDRALVGYYGARAGVHPKVKSDGSAVAFTTASEGYGCTSQADPTPDNPNSSPSAAPGRLGPSGWEGGTAIAVWSRDEQQVSYIAELNEDQYHPLCGYDLPDVSFVGSGRDLIYQNRTDLQRSAWDELDRRDIHLTITNITQCEMENGTINEDVCPDGGLDGGAFDSDNFLNAQSWFDDAKPEYSERITSNEQGDLDMIRELNDDPDSAISTSETPSFYRVTGKALEVMPVVNIAVQLWDEDVGLSTEYERADTSLVDGQTASLISFEPSTSDWAFHSQRDDDGLNVSWLRGDGEADDLDRGGHPAIMSFDISTRSPDDLKRTERGNLPNSSIGDIDGDGLLDGWELHGYETFDINQDNVVTTPNPSDIETVVVLDPDLDAIPSS